MMPVLWFIGRVLLFLLKVLLVILAVLLILAVLILVLPIRYECTAKGCSEQIRAVEARGKIQAFLGLAQLKAKLSGGILRITFHVGGFTLKKMQKTVIPQKESVPEDEESGRAPAADTEPADLKPGEEEAAEEDIVQPAREDRPSGVKEPEPEKEDRQPGAKEPEPAKETESETHRGTGSGDEQAEPENGSGTEKENRKLRKAESAGGREKSSGKKSRHGETPARTGGEESGGILDKVRSGWEALQDQKNQRSLLRIKRAAGRIVRHVLPGELKVHGVVGTGDPASTGWILGLFYMFWPRYGDSGDYRLAGEFEKMLLKGKIYFRGRIIPAVPVINAAGLLLDGNIRRRIFKRRK